ncbi:LOW QUALITY PROTEIN: prolyl endopeptidase-like [Asterias amurensis]|uniref:LOW QUALITY PROTEIN: prolyl endopeptidase-like n=1 Tax=Asterias amurensis TaxID=7602 RepID=UPI003AB58F56
MKAIKLCYQLHRHHLQSISEGCGSIHSILRSHLLMNQNYEQQRCFCNESRVGSQNVSWPTARRQAAEAVYHGHRQVDHYSWMKGVAIKKDLRKYIQQEKKQMENMLKETQPIQERVMRWLEKMDLENTRTEMPTVVDGSIYFKESLGESWGYYRNSQQDEGKTDKTSAELLLNTAMFTELYGHPVVITSVKISPNQQHMAFIVETSSMDTYDAHILQIGHGASKYVERIADVFSIEFAHDGVLYYTKMKSLRAASVWRHLIGQDVSDDQIILEESDDKFFIDLSHTKDRCYITINVNSSTTSEVYLIDSQNQDGASLMPVRPRQSGVQYFVEHSRGTLYILTNAYEDKEYRLITCKMPDGGTIRNALWSECRTLFTPEAAWRILDMDVFSSHCVLCIMDGIRPKINVIHLDSQQLRNFVEVNEKFCKIIPGPNATCSSSAFQFSLASPVIPSRDFLLDVQDGSIEERTDARSLEKTEHLVKKSAISKECLCTRQEARSKDGTLVPITVLHRADVSLHGCNPMLIHGYGAYGEALDMSYSSHTALLIELGWVVAYCHVRGGSDLGLHWHHMGRALHKVNSLEDIEACVSRLHELSYSQPRMTAIHGTSAGGLLAAAVCNRSPNLFQAAILEVPYVDVLSTMLDPDLPLTLQETEEWGSPLHDPKAFNYIRSYCPYHNITQQEYPSMLIIASLADSRVPFWVPLKYTAKLRHMMKSSKHSSNALCLWVQEEGGHFGQGGETSLHEQMAVQTAFLYKVLGLSMDSHHHVQSE